MIYYYIISNILSGEIIKLINLILKNPFRNKTRATLSIIGIAIGIATIVALGLITTGLEDSVQTTFNEGGAEITVSNGTSIGSSSGEISSDYIDKIKNISDVQDVVGVLSVTVRDSSHSNDKSGSMMRGTTVYGINPSKLALVGISDIEGSSIKNGSYVAIIGKQYSDIQNKTIGDSISIQGKDFEIVGIYETGSVMSDSGVYVPYDVLSDLTGEDTFSRIMVKTTEDANNTAVAKAIENKYDDLITITTEEMASMMRDVTDILDTASLAISLLAIFVGGIGIVNTMIMSVYERTKEIGVLKSVGWKSKNILIMIMGETLVLTISAAIVGSIGGILISEAAVFVLDSGNFTLGFSLDTFVLAFGVAILVGIIGGVYPAYKASKLVPTEALRYE